MNRTLAGLLEAQELARSGALFLASDSGGKDSQAEYLAMLRLGIPAEQMIVIHADLGEIEWPGTLEHIRSHVREEHPVHLVQAISKDGSDKDFFDLVHRNRARLDAQGRHHIDASPNGSERFCTGELKTQPIWRDAKRAAKARGMKGGIIVNCVGIRGPESGNRAKRVTERPTSQITVNKQFSNGLWDCRDWWPIANWELEDVWSEIRDAGQQPHWAYGFDGVRATKNQRLSCRFCIFGSLNDLRNAATLYPDLANKYIQLELDTRSTLHVDGVPLTQKLQGIPLININAGNAA
jgi:3'-phosphoadenosine 5'-phosphosulfate sulfotransferase (PAPS reductase)/FAD synthetase